MTEPGPGGQGRLPGSWPRPSWHRVSELASHPALSLWARGALASGCLATARPRPAEPVGATCLPPTQQKEEGGPGSRDTREPPGQEYEHPLPSLGRLSNQTLPPGYREGFLWKRGRDNGQFLSRKFVLTEREGALKYFNRSDVSGFRGQPPT